MLAEMGVRVWLPSEVKTAVAAQAAVPEAILDRPSPPLAVESVAIPLRREPPLRLPVLNSPPPVSGASVRYIIGNLPADAASFDIVLLGEPCMGDAQKLLANMTRVLGDKVFVAEMVSSQNDSASLADQLTNFPAKVILALGPHSAKALLGEASTATPFGKLRGTAHSADGMSGKVVVTYHPLQLLRQPLAKAQAWIDLKLAMKEAK